MLSPIVHVDPRCIVPVDWLLMVGGVSDGDQREGNHMLWDSEQMLQSLDPAFDRVNAQPDRSQSQLLSLDQDVFGGCRTVLDPEAFFFLKRLVTADQQCDWGLWNHVGKAMNF